MEHVQQGRVRGMRIVFVIFSLVHTGAGKLQIRKTDSPIDARLGTFTTIPCLFYGYEASSLDTSIISVRWERKDKLVYDFIDARHIPYRSGSYIPEDRLLKGDASLYIPHIQTSDEGDYTCSVIVMPEDTSSKVTVQLSAFPSCILSDSTLVMIPDTETSVTCYVNGFYPESVKIQWLKYSKSSSNQSSLNSQHCTRAPVQNHDGTYNVTSVLSVRPMSTDEDGDVYSCVISHRSLADGLNCNVSLSVYPVPVSKLVLILLIVLGILVLLAVLAGVFIYIRYIKKAAPPEIMNSIVPELIHMQKTSWLCPIENLTSTDIDLGLYIETGTTDKRQVDKWSSKTAKRDEEIPLLPHPHPHPPPYLKLRPFIATSGKGLFSCVCYIDITPQFDKHHCAKLILEVKHKAVKDPIRKEWTLAVKVPLQVMDITGPELIHMQKTTLECAIENFTPEDIDLVLYIIKDIKKSQVIKWSNKPAKSNQEIHPHPHPPPYLELMPIIKPSLKVFFSCVCYIDITPQFDEHDGAKMILEVNHKLAKDPIYKGLILKVKVPPVLDPIKANKESYNVGDPLELTCKIHSFHPQNINVTWCTDEEALDSENSEAETNTKGLFYVTSRVQTTIEEEDFRKEFWCQVEHQGVTKVVTWKLQKQVQAAKEADGIDS